MASFSPTSLMVLGYALRDRDHSIEERFRGESTYGRVGGKRAEHGTEHEWGSREDQGSGSSGEPMTSSM